MTTETTSPRPRRRGLLFGVITVIALGLFAVSAAFAGGGWGGHCGAHANMDPEAKASFVAERIANHADADAEQQEAIEAVLSGFFADMDTMKAEKETFRAQARDLLTAETIDADALQALRADGMKTADDASVQAIDALAEIAAILTPEQRADLADDWERMHKRWNK